MSKASVCRLCMKDTKEYILIFDDETETEILYLFKLFQLIVTPDPCKPNICCMECYLKLVNFQKFHERCIESERLWDLKVPEIKNEDTSDEDSNQTADEFIATDIFEAEEDEKHISLTDIANNHLIEEVKTTSNVRKHLKFYECYLCLEKYPRKRSLSRHMRKKHILKTRTNGEATDENIIIIDGQKRYKCNICHKTLSTPRNLSRHSYYVHNIRILKIKKITNGQYECELCHKKVTTKFNLKRHMDGHSRSSHTNREQKDKSDIKDARYECNFCHKAFKMKGTLSSHIKRHITPTSNQRDKSKAEGIIIDGQKRYICKICHKTFSSARNLNRHSYNIHNIDNFTVKSQIKKSEGQYECDICHNKFVKKFNLKRHLDVYGPVHSTNLNTNEKLKQKLDEEDKQIQESFGLQCPKSECGFRSKTFIEYKSHLRSVHNERYPGVVCCGRKLEAHVDVIDHINLHLNPEKLQCKYCKRIFSDTKNLKRHINQKHGSDDVKPYTCEPCGKRFSLMCDLKSHMFIHLTDATKQSLKIYDCGICEKKFQYKITLKKHIEYNHLKQGIMCSDCGKLCKSKEVFESHRRNVHNAKTSKIQCPTCKKWYACRKSLRTHIRNQHNVLTESQQFVCHFCGTKFSTKPNLRNHMIRNHMERAFKCEYCPKSFPSSERLKEHIAMHTGIPLYSCPYCSHKHFNRRVNMYKHFRVMHCKEWNKDKDLNRQNSYRRKNSSKYMRA